MFRMHLLFLILILSITYSIAQAPDTLWTKTFGGSYFESGRSVQQTIDGGYIIVGGERSFNPTGYDNVWLIKTDAYGDTIWTKSYGGSSWDFGYSVQQTTDSGYIITGYTDSFGAGLADVWLIKMDAFGDTLWTKTFGGSADDYGYSVRQTLDGGYIITGSTASFSANYGDVWLIKTDSSGDTLWVKSLVQNSSSWGNSVQQTIDGGYIIVGGTYSFTSDSDVWLVKTNSSGDTLWTRTFGGSQSDVGRSVQQTNDGGYVVVGYTISFGTLSYDVWLIKTNSSGDTLWTKTFGGSDDDKGYSVQQTTEGAYIITGYTDSFGGGLSDVWLIKTTPDISNIEPNTDLVISDFSLQQNYPNPFNPSTIISWQSPIGSWQTLKIYDVLGNEVSTLVDEYKPAGKYEVEFSAKGGSASGGNAYSLPSGVYFYRLKAGSFIETKKMILLK